MIIMDKEIGRFWHFKSSIKKTYLKNKWKGDKMIYFAFIYVRKPHVLNVGCDADLMAS